LELGSAARVASADQANAAAAGRLIGEFSLIVVSDERRAGDVAAKLLPHLALVGTAAHGRVQAETVHVRAPSDG